MLLLNIHSFGQSKHCELIAHNWISENSTTLSSSTMQDDADFFLHDTSHKALFLMSFERLSY